MKLMCSRSLAIKCLLLGLLVAATPAGARTRPHYGGSIVIELQEPAIELDPASAQTSSEMRAQILPLLFETLTTLDDHGTARPLLASGWRRVHATRWAITLRKDVRFADGSPLVLSGVADQFTRMVPGLRAQAQSDGTLIMDTPAAWDRLPEMLSLPRFAICKRYEDGTTVGTGAFAVKQWQAGKSLTLTRNSGYWGAAPFLDYIEVHFAGSSSALVIPGRTGNDLMEITLPQARNVADADLRFGEPTQLYALVWSSHAQVDERVRKALPLAVGRDSLAAAFGRDDVVPAYSYLPQQVSGYAFLFHTQADPSTAREFVRDARRTAPLALAYLAGDPVARLVSDRIAVNARDAGLNVQPFGDHDPRAALAGSAQAALVRVSVIGGSPAAALYDLASSLQLDSAPIWTAADPEKLLRVERDLLNDDHVMPVLFVPSVTWISPRLHDVSNAPQWHLDSAWLAGDAR